MALRSELSSSCSRRPRSTGGQGVAKWKIIMPAVVIVAAVVWIIYLIGSGGESRNIEVPQAGEVMGRIVNSIGEREDLLERVSIRLEGEAPNQVIKIDGTVKTRAMLDELTAKVNESKGEVRVDMNVTVKP